MKELSDKIEDINRRKWLVASSAALAASVPLMSVADDHAHHDKAHKAGHHHHSNPLSKVVETALASIGAGQACQSHCYVLLQQGDLSIVDCMKSVDEMVAMSNALVKMASNQSAHVKALMKVCMQVCDDCEKQCRKHEDKHPECKACAESCVDCIKACKAALA